MRSLVLALSVFISVISFAGDHIELTSEFTQEKFKVSVLSLEEAEELFEYLSTRSMIPFDIKWDGCYARAYLMNTAANLKNINLAKIIVEVVDREKGVMKVPSEDGKWVLRWYYHVAPIVFVKNQNGDVEEYVLDPSLFQSPVTRQSFLDKLLTNSDGVEVDHFILPKYVFDKAQLMSKANLRKIDNMMLVQMAEVKGITRTAGNYHEKAPFYDENVEAWYLGGHEVKAPVSTEGLML